MIHAANRESHFKSAVPYGQPFFNSLWHGGRWTNKLYRALVLSVLALHEVSHSGNAADLQPEFQPESALAEEDRGAALADLNTNPSHKINILIYGLSYHPDKRNKQDNEQNWGLGVNYEFFEDTQGVGFVEAGVYRDSGSNLAKYGGAGYQFKLGKNWRIGAMLVGVQSQSYHEGRFFIAPIPVVTYDFGIVKLNAIYIPRYRDYNQFAAFGLMFSIPFSE
jgi:hypothetical protein